MDSRFTNDGLHLKGDGYLLWKHLIYPYVFDLQRYPSLIPMPLSIQWRKSWVPIYKFTSIVINNPVLTNEAELVRQELVNSNCQLVPEGEASKAAYRIELNIKSSDTIPKSEEGYYLKVDSNKIIISSIGRGYNIKHPFYSDCSKTQNKCRILASLSHIKIRNTSSAN